MHTRLIITNNCGITPTAPPPLGHCEKITTSKETGLILSEGLLNVF